MSARPATLSSPWRQKPRIMVAARRDFFVKSLSHFGKFLVNANFDLITKWAIYKNKKNNDSVYILSIQNIVNFSHTSQIHFCFKNTPKAPFKPMGQKIPKLHPLWDVDSSNTPIHRPTPLITPSSI